MAQQELHSDQQTAPEYTTSTGVGLSDLAAQARERYFFVLASEYTPWKDLSQEDKLQWIDACQLLIEFYAEEVSSGWDNIARRFAHNLRTDEWDSLPQPIQLAYEVVARHVWNMHQAEDELDLKDAMEFNWQIWFKPKIEGMNNDSDG